jgi:glycosyltransferase involved in cell wall biosynthesis
VRFLGWRDDPWRFYADLDVVILTSRNEGTPVALIEAAAAGVPAVATRVGGVPAVVADGGTGLLVAPGDAEALAAAVLSLLRDAPLRRAMSARARATVPPRFSSARLLARLARLYEREIDACHRFLSR